METQALSQKVAQKPDSDVYVEANPILSGLWCVVQKNGNHFAQSRDRGAMEARARQINTGSSAEAQGAK